VSAAWDLTSPDNPNACDVTIFQMGGRLGGKGASSRNRDFGDRIEEHGLHLWLGYYENAFRMIRTCYETFRELSNPDDPQVRWRLAPPSTRNRAKDPQVSRHIGLDRPEYERPFDNWDWLSAFERANRVGLADDASGDWVPWVARFPEYVLKAEDGLISRYSWPDGTTLPGVHLVDDPSIAYPGEEPPVVEVDGEPSLEPPSVAFFLTHALRELGEFIDSLELRVEKLIDQSLAPFTDDPNSLLAQALRNDPRTPTRAGDPLPDDALRGLRIVRLTLLVPALEAFTTVARFAEGPLPFVRGPFVAMLDRYIDSMRERVEIFVQGDTAARRIWELIDLLAANIRGVIVAGLDGDDDFSSLDEWNYIDWLRMNRISERTLRNPIIRGAHDLGFAYRDGNSRDPQIAAGQALNAGCRFFFMYKGALFWRMKAGMGDVVFAPMYLALRARGVKFRFFHRLDDIELNADATAVTRLRFGRQLRLKDEDTAAGTNYQPLVAVAGKNMSGWRTCVDSGQVQGDPPPKGLDFESIWCEWNAGDVVFATVGEPSADSTRADCIGHFTDVIVTVPVAALGRVSQRLAHAEHPAGHRWRAMLDNIGTVATQAMQLWVCKPTHELGWMHGQVSFSAFVHPFDTWADLSQLVKVENQPCAQGVHYFCSVLPDSQVRLSEDGRTVDVKATLDLVKENARCFIDDWLYQLWPDAVHRYPNAFKRELLVGVPSGGIVDPLDTQHIVANVDPAQRYTQSLPGTTKYRIRPDQTGFEHLVIAGDWTECGLNFGCVEGAVISGKLASAAITSFPDTRLIPGYGKRMDRSTVLQGGT